MKGSLRVYCRCADTALQQILNTNDNVAGNELVEKSKLTKHIIATLSKMMGPPTVICATLWL